MNRFEAGIRTAENAAIRTLDTSAFTAEDVVNIALQRPEVMQDIRGHAEAVRAWTRGDTGPMRLVAEMHRDTLIARALAFVFMEYHALRPLLQRLAPQRVADIGAGYGFFALFIHAEFGAEVTLIDTDSTTDRGFHYTDVTHGLSNLARARSFLIANGCDREKIHTRDPHIDDLTEIKGLDLAVSLLACGFEFPCDTYLDFFEHSVKPGGCAILDIRTRHAHEILPSLSALGALSRVCHAADGQAIRMQLTTRRRSQDAAA